MKRDDPIGVFDSGIGGFSVVRRLQSILPGEKLIYFGDSIHVPYGSKSTSELLGYVRSILRFMESRHVKAVAVACNTTSSLIDEYRNDYSFPLFSIVETGCRGTAGLPVEKLGVICTPFTARVNLYGRLLNEIAPHITVLAAGCPNLARLIEEGSLSGICVDEELHRAVDPLISRGVTHLLLGCTHYPLISPYIERLFPHLMQIDPAFEQAVAVRAYLRRSGLERCGGNGTIELNTSGDAEQFLKAAMRFGLKNVIASNESRITD